MVDMVGMMRMVGIVGEWYLKVKKLKVSNLFS